MARSRVSPQSHVALAMSVRPTRLGMLVPTSALGVTWMEMFEAALAAQARVWGGSDNLIFPLTADLADRELFWELADRFDADAYVTYAPTWAEVAEFAPDPYHAHMSELRRQASELDIGANALADFVEEANDHIAFDVQPTPQQQALINARLAPFHHPGDADWLHNFNATRSSGWPFTDAAEFADLPKQIVNPIGPGGAARKLLLTATVGRVSIGLRRELAERDVVVADESMRRNYQWAGIVADRSRGGHPAYPWTIARQGLATYHNAPWQADHAVVVVGDSPWDFALFYALKRMGGMAWWLPSWLRRDQAYVLELGSALEYEPRREGRKLVIVSASSSTIRDRIAHELDQFPGRELSVKAAGWREVVPESPLRRYERDNVGRTELVQMLDGETLDLRTPLPRLVRTEEPTGMRWLTELHGHDWTPIRHQALGTALLRGMHPNPDFVRTTRDGIGYFSPGGVLIQAGASLESVVARPTLRPLGVLEQVRTILEPLGWTCEPSDKGIYASESMRLFGGFRKLCDALREPNVRIVLDAYRNRPSGAPGRRLSSDNRRYLTWRHFELLLAGQSVVAIIDGLLAGGVLRRGLVLKCRRCRQEAWHSLGAIGETFECGRCHLEQTPDRQSWLGNDEPVWSYRMAEVLYQFLENDGELPVLAVRDAFHESERPLGHAYEVELTPPEGKGCEIDIFSADGYRLWIGEAKKNGRFEPGRLQFVADLASLLDAYGVLLTTSRPSWPRATLDQVRAIFSSAWPRLRMLSAVRTVP